MCYCSSLAVYLLLLLVVLLPPTTSAPMVTENFDEIVVETRSFLVDKVSLATTDRLSSSSIDSVDVVRAESGRLTMITVVLAGVDVNLADGDIGIFMPTGNAQTIVRGEFIGNLAVSHTPLTTDATDA
ncbi:unnamed protein product [Nippostrongylus brasiliensis]|uniref:Secreted protein n=1 Tax=Nippostrongylus brasiliensis TaxID=27835 RepID=A0A0N4YA93_NIPBR|nr:unnamed protein product [Nippostrongylus brasiliensis]